MKHACRAALLNTGVILGIFRVGAAPPPPGGGKKKKTRTHEGGRSGLGGGLGRGGKEYSRGGDCLVGVGCEN